MGPRAWVLNLDAEDELARPRGYAPTRASLERVAHARPAALALLAPGDVALAHEPSDADAAARGLPGLAWCPTPSALARLAAAGAVPEPAPAFDVLRRANDRALAAGLGLGVPGTRVVRSEEDVLAALHGEPAGADWLLQRAHGAAGRGRRKVRAEEWSVADAAWLAASLRSGAPTLEPFVAVERELALHGWIDPAGGLVLGAPCAQETDASGAWRASRRLAPGEASREVVDALHAAAERGARALAALGYHGPFGADALLWRDADGERRLAALTDLNARYTLGWPVGMGVPGGRTDGTPDRERDAPA